MEEPQQEWPSQPGTCKFAPTPGSSGRPCLPTMHLVQLWGPGSIIVDQVSVCTLHRPRVTEMARSTRLGVWEVLFGDFCALGATVSGTDVHGPCRGTLGATSFDPIPTGRPRTEHFDVYLCQNHRPGLRINLPAGHPTLIWDRIMQSVHGEPWGQPSARQARIVAAQRAAHGLAPDAPTGRIREAEGSDARTTYRWFLLYLRAYAALLDETADDVEDVDRLTIPFRVFQPVPGPGSQEGYDALVESGRLVDQLGRPLEVGVCEWCRRRSVLNLTCVYAVPCPSCPAPAGSPCTRPSEHKLSDRFGGTHSRRVTAATQDEDRRLAAGDMRIPAPWLPKAPVLAAAAPVVELEVPEQLELDLAAMLFGVMEETR